MLLLLHLVSTMRPANDGGLRFGVVLDISPLFTSGAFSGEREIDAAVREVTNRIVEMLRVTAK